MMQTRSFNHNNNHQQQAHDDLMLSRLNLYKNAAEEEFYPQQLQQQHYQQPQHVPRERRGIAALMMLQQQQQQLQLLQQQQLLSALHHHQPQSPPRPAVSTNSRHMKVKQVLPCFNLICTGTCAYGPKCTFLHDPRAQLPKHIRKQAEFILQSHLHTYRPNLNKVKQQQQHHQQQLLQSAILHGGCYNEDDECSSECHTDSECSSHNGDAGFNGLLMEHSPTRSGSPSCVWQSTTTTCDQMMMKQMSMPQSSNNSAANTNTLTFKKDDIFSFPTMELTYQEPNSKCYDPTEEQISSYSREMTMWYNFLSTVNEKYGNSTDTIQYDRRLPIFECLSHGM